MRLKPIQALLHPLWLGALGLLVVNDHVLKAAGWLPTWFTGKLSDVAGLIVAPVLLAALLQVRSRRGVMGSFVAVAAVFAALQVVPGAAVLWDGVLSSIGVPWLTVADPTDLLALPAMVVAYHALLPAMKARHLTTGQRSVAWAGSGLGLLACLATSPPRTWTETTGGGGGGGFAAFDAQVWLHNDTDATRFVLIRQLRPDVVLDCNALAGSDAGSLLGSDLFSAAVAWELPPRTTVSALSDPFDRSRSCHAVRVEGDSFDHRVLFWQGFDPQWVPGDANGDDAGQTLPSGRVTLPDFDDGGAGVAFVVRPPLDPLCEPQSELDRVDWSMPDRGTWTLDSWEVGVDGCISLDLATEAGERRGYLCMPPERFAFEAGDELELDATTTTLSVTRSSDGSRLVLAHVRAGDVLPYLDVQPGFDDTELACGWVTDDCGHVSRDAAISIDALEGEGTVTMSAGDVEIYELTDEQVIVEVTRAEYRALNAGECGDGPDLIDFDIDLVLVANPTL